MSLADVTDLPVDASPLYANDAEVALLGEILYRPPAIREAAAVVTPDDFANTRLGLVYGLISGLVTAATDPNTVDFLTITAEITRRRAAHPAHRSGPRWLDPAELAGLVTSGTGRWEGPARLVLDAAIRRRLVKVAQQTIQLAYSDDDSAAVAPRAAAMFTELRDAHTPAGRLTARTLGEVLDTDDPGYDWVIPGLLERADRMIITGEEGLGKALALDTPIPTTKGWVTMVDLGPGDEVFAPDGTPARVVAATDVMHGRPCYRVHFSDGSSLVADEQHLWLTETLKAREAAAKASRRTSLKPRGTDQRHLRRHYPQIVTTGEIAETLMARGGHAKNHSIATCAPLQFPAQELPLDPYTLGAWLGDGTSASASITCHDDDTEILDRIAAGGWPVRKTAATYRWALGDGKGKGVRGTATLAGLLRAMRVLGDKHIPEAYQVGSVDQRLALLQGLMDTDGTISTDLAPTFEFSVCSKRLAEDVHRLLLGLGIKVTFRSSPARLYGRQVGTRYRLSFQTELDVFSLTRKAQRIKPLRTRRSDLRYVTAVERIDSVPVRCIQVDRPDGMYVAGRECIPTHNSTFLRQLVICAAAGIHPLALTPIRPVTAVVVDAENSERQWRRKVTGMVHQARRHGTADPRDTIHLACVGRMDLTGPGDLAAVHRLLDEHTPDILVIGPLYKMLPKAINSDDDAAPLIASLDSLRDRGPCLLMEAHAGHATTGAGGSRDLRPRGSAALLGWPEFGFGIARSSDDPEHVADVRRWRGDRDERDWPSQLIRGGPFPWSDEGVPAGRRAAFRAGGVTGSGEWSPSAVLDDLGGSPR